MYNQDESLGSEKQNWNQDEDQNQNQSQYRKQDRQQNVLIIS